MLDANQGQLVVKVAQYHIESRLSGKFYLPKGIRTRPRSTDILQRN